MRNRANTGLDEAVRNEGSVCLVGPAGLAPVEGRAAPRLMRLWPASSPSHSCCVTTLA